MRMRAERLIKILIILQQGETITTRRLANELNVSERTIHRDMESLSLIGIPIYSERGPAGGWHLVDGWKQRLSYLTETEITSLFLTVSEKVFSDLNIDISVDKLKEKLLLSVPKYIKNNALNVWERIYIDTNNWRHSSEKVKFLETSQQAVMEDRQLMMKYRKVNNEEKTYRINPLGLVAKGNTWYIIALNHEGEYRNFKISRIVHVDLLEDRFERPKEFVLKEYWKNSKRDFIQALPEFNVEVEISKHIIDRIMFTGRFVRMIQADDTDGGDSWIKSSLSFPTKEEAINFILGFGNQMKLITPVYLQNELTKRAEEVIKLYKQGANE